MTTAAIRVAKHLDGWFFNSCPWYLTKSPAVSDVAALYGWRADGCLDPHRLNVAQRKAVEAFARGVGAAQMDNMPKGGDHGKGKG